MQKLSQFIDIKSRKDINLNEYQKIIVLIEENKKSNPDIAIEGCKSLVEGISKYILLNIGNKYTKIAINKLEFPLLFKEMVNNISEYNEDFEIDFTNRICSVVHIIAEIRNKRGDLSHGKIYPKEEQSTEMFSELIIHITEAMLLYILTSFYTIDLSHLEESKYEDYPEFNDHLDLIYEEFGLSYSKALFDQDYTQYYEQLIDFNLQKEEKK